MWSENSDTCLTWLYYLTTKPSVGTALWDATDTVAQAKETGQIGGHTFLLGHTFFLALLGRVAVRKNRENNSIVGVSYHPPHKGRCAPNPKAS